MKGHKNIILSFHPLAWTPICARQMSDLESHYDELSALDTVALGFSADSVPCKKAWGEYLGIVKTSLACDFWPHGKIAKLFGVFNDQDGTNDRAVFVVSKEGMIVFKKKYPLSQVPDIEEIMEAVRSIEKKEVAAGV